jgi:hypothetical protein
MRGESFTLIVLEGLYMRSFKFLIPHVLYTSNKHDNNNNNLTYLAN